MKKLPSVFRQPTLIIASLLLLGWLVISHPLLEPILFLGALLFLVIYIYTQASAVIIDENQPSPDALRAILLIMIVGVGATAIAAYALVNGSSASAPEILNEIQLSLGIELIGAVVFVLLFEIWHTRK